MIALTGANSAVGLNLLRHIGEGAATRAIAVVRSDRAAATLPAGEHLEPKVVSYHDTDSLVAAIEGADCVVHLAGILIETRGVTYHDANVATTESVLRAAHAAGVQHVVFISVVGADHRSTNAYLRSKGEAEVAVAESGLAATIIRTPILLGPGTAGADALVRTVSGGRARLLGGGHYTMRPLDPDDLSRAVLNACAEPRAGVTIHELVGPEPIPYRALVSRFAEQAGEDLSVGSVPIAVAKLGAAVTSRLRGGGVTPAVIDVITADEVVDTNAAGALGVTLTPLDETLAKIRDELPA